jgi:hypothetical protein
MDVLILAVNKNAVALGGQCDTAYRPDTRDVHEPDFRFECGRGVSVTENFTSRIYEAADTNSMTFHGF